MENVKAHTIQFFLIYEKNLKYREASDDEDSDKEDTPVVESCILVETLMLSLETTPVMFLENLKKESARERRPYVPRKPKRPSWLWRQTWRQTRTRTATCRALFRIAASTRMTTSKWLWEREKEEKF
ncbi:uncharacterized protein LOC124207523 isoform X1 [Daphnia pulex]|uniref:uncharacterized protein LOC124207523 isoform X1 n=1 Tax=Daphnia pulex TaxID=6669 RepID=UPI001EDD41EC|nr:uncharacterized protein LOC124207523 isoform X1 [Daphnia pulex]